jgi:HSP20 family protein
MTLIRRPSPFGELLSLRQAMDRLFDETLFRPLGGSTFEETRAMPLDIYATGDALVIEAALPGVRPEDVEVSLLGDTLTLTATTASARSSEDAGYQVQEVRRGKFSRTVALPSGLKTEGAAASFENGMLRLSIPKAEQAKPRQIPVTTPTEGMSSVSEGSQAESAASGPAGGAPTA